MTYYRVSFERWGYVDVEADSVEEAEDKAMQEEVTEPDEGWIMIDDTKIIREGSDD